MVRFWNKFVLSMLILTLVFNIFSISVGAVSREDLDSAEKNNLYRTQGRLAFLP